MTEEEQNELNSELINAAYASNMVLIRSLVKRGADVKAGDSMALCSSSNLEVIKFFIENGSNIHAGSNASLMNAALNERYDIVEYLLQNGADVHARNDMVLYYAAHNKHLELVKYFVVEHDCNVQIALKEAKKLNDNKTIAWCKKYIESKRLNDKLNVDLSKTDDVNKKLKV